MTKRMIIMLVIVGLLFGGVFAFQAFKGTMIRKYMAAQGTPAQTVSTMKAETAEWQPGFQTVGTVRAMRGADIAPEVAGVVTAIHFDSGEEVRQGAPLVQLSAASDAARLRSLEASAELAQANYARSQQQFKIQAISKAVLDADAAAVKTAKAQLAEQQALLDKKLVRAPFAGKLGIRAVDLGQYVNAGTTLVTLQALDPVFVDFSVPQTAIGRISLKEKVSVAAEGLDGRFDGTISAIAPRVDTATRNVLVRATLPNPKRVLLPGMFATVQISSGAPQRHITLPQTAVTYNPYGDTVYVIEEKKGEDGKTSLLARQKFVTTGERRGDQVAILSGIKEGETVVTSGQLKLRPGTPVAINNSIQPSNDPSPRPENP